MNTGEIVLYQPYVRIFGTSIGLFVNKIGRIYEIFVNKIGDTSIYIIKKQYFCSDKNSIKK